MLKKYFLNTDLIKKYYLELVLDTSLSKYPPPSSYLELNERRFEALLPKWFCNIFKTAHLLFFSASLQ